jgi:hypothetical protein
MLTSLILLSALMAVPARGGDATVAGPVPRDVQLTLRLSPEEQVALEEHVCAFAAEMRPWHDASDPLFFATGPTARLDDQELWAGSMRPLLAARYDNGLPHFVVLGVPVMLPLPRIAFSVTGWHPIGANC